MDVDRLSVDEFGEVFKVRWGGGGGGVVVVGWWGGGGMSQEVN